MMRARLIEKVKEDLLVGVDGYAVYWPSCNRGALSALDLRAIADEIDRLNVVWDSIVQAELSSTSCRQDRGDQADRPSTE